MPSQCNFFASFAAENRKQLINHIGRCHRNDPNFHCMCGLDGCTKTFKKYYSWRKHLKQKHAELPAEEDCPTINMDREAGDERNGDEPNGENVEDPTRSAALYILKLQEDCCMPKSTVESVLSNTKTIVQETLSVVRTHIQDCLNSSNINYGNVPGLNEIFQEDNVNPFKNLATAAQRLAYYKEQFGLNLS